MSHPKYKTGDKVKIINYGHVIWTNSDTDILKVNGINQLGRKAEYNIFDIMPEIVGKEGVVSEVKTIQNTPRYSIEGIPQKHAWYSEEQLELLI